MPCVPSNSPLQIIRTDISIGIIETPNARGGSDSSTIDTRGRPFIFSYRRLSPARPSVELENADEKMTCCYATNHRVWVTLRASYTRLHGAN